MDKHNKSCLHVTSIINNIYTSSHAKQMADTLYEGNSAPSFHSGTRKGGNYKVQLCNKVYNEDGTPNGKRCPYGPKCTFRHPVDETRIKTKDCENVKPDGSGCKYGDACNYRHPGDSGFGESANEQVGDKQPHAVKGPKPQLTTATKAQKSKHDASVKQQPDGVSYTAMLESLEQVIKTHPVVSVVLDDAKDAIELIKRLVVTTKKVDIICQKTNGK